MTTQRKGGRPTPKMKANAVKMAMGGIDSETVAKKYGVKPATVDKWVAAAAKETVIEPRKEIKEKMAERRYFAKHNFKYGGRVNPIKLARGEVFELRGMPNDSMLVDLGYIGVLQPEDTVYKDDATGKTFKNQTDAYAYARTVRKLANAEGNPDLQDSIEEREDARMGTVLGKQEIAV